VQEYQYLIVGGGLAGGKACQGIRDVDQDGSVGLITGEEHPPYHRPPLSKGFLKGEADLEKVYLDPEEAYREMDVDLIEGVWVESIQPDDKTITLDNGDLVGYDRLLLATGGRANRLPLWGSELDGVFTLRNIEDARQIREAAGPNVRALVLGGSFIGAEVTASLAQMGTMVVEIFPEARLLEHIAPEELSAHLQDMFESHNVRVLPGTVAESLEGERAVRRAVLDTGERLDIDLVVMGVGIKLNSQLAQDAGLEVRQDGAVVVDEYLRTANPDIFAAGDVTAYPDPQKDQLLHVEHWDVARGQGRTAGRNMAGKEQPYQDTPYFFSDMFEFSFEVWGDLTSWDDVIRRGDLEDGGFAYYYFDQGRLAGVLAVGRPEEEREAMPALIRQGPAQAEVADQLRDEDFDLNQLVE